MSNKILILTRLMSGFVTSVKTRKWKPTGTPAIYRIIDFLDASQCDLDIIFTLKNSESLPSNYLKAPFSIKGLSAKLIILAGPSVFPRFFGSMRTYLSELSQCWSLLRYIRKQRPDFLYIDRANILIGAVIARFTRVPVHLRLLGAPPSLEELLTKPALSHYLYRWAYRSPFRMVLCSRDGSPAERWMKRALDAKTPRKRWINGVDEVPQINKSSKLIRVVLIGRLNPLKCIDEAVQAILALPKSQLEKIHIDIIGDGELFKPIRHHIESSGCASQFTLHGAIPHSEVLNKLVQSDILISLNTHGNLTNTVLESIRCGLCLVLPEADTRTGLDQDTYTILPKNSVVQIKRENLRSDLKDKLSDLIEHPDVIEEYQRKIKALSKNISTWDQRIAREIQLLRPYDFVIVIGDLQGGGTQKVLERLLPQWVKQKKRIAVVTLDIAKNDAIQLPDMVDRISLGGVSESGNFLSGLVSNAKRLLAIRRAIKRLNVPTVISFLSTMNVLTVMAARGLKCRLIISERNDPARQSFGRFWDYLRRKYYRYADVVTANSHSALKSLAEFVQQEKCHYVPNPIVIPDDIQPISLEKKTILAVGRLHGQKAYDVLIDAFALFSEKYTEWQLVILGEGPLRQKLEAQINQHQLNDLVKLMGYVNPFPYYAAADIYTMPSRYEGMPNALLEALAIGLPSIISDALVGPLKFISDHKEALIVPVENTVALSSAFSELADNHALRESLSNSAKQAIQPFLMEAVLPEWEVLFND